MHAYKRNNINSDFTITGSEASLVYTVGCTGEFCKCGSGFSDQLKHKLLALLSNPKFKKKKTFAMESDMCKSCHINYRLRFTLLSI